VEKMRESPGALPANLLDHLLGFWRLSIRVLNSGHTPTVSHLLITTTLTAHADRHPR
jgi:hypothetical protein